MKHLNKNKNEYRFGIKKWVLNGLKPRGRGGKHLRKKAFPYRELSALLALLVVVGLIIFFAVKGKESRASAPVDAPIAESNPVKPVVYRPAFSRDTAEIDGAVQSEFAVILEAESGLVLAERNAVARMHPASMTKVLTLLVAAEQIKDKTGTFTMTREIGDYCYTNDCSVVGYMVGEQIPIKELFYGCILSSGADASLALAEVACGSHEAFVEKINQKIEELDRGYSAHFTNAVGIYDEDHYCTALDMAVFLKAAMENEFCKEVLSTKKFDSTPTASHPEGQVLSNWFLRRVEDQESGDMIISSAKTGFVAQAGSCAVSYGENSKGKGFICVSGKGSSSWQAIYDHVALYRQFGASIPTN